MSNILDDLTKEMLWMFSVLLFLFAKMQKQEAGFSSYFQEKLKYKKYSSC